jgi:hypothetical protein
VGNGAKEWRLQSPLARVEQGADGGEDGEPKTPARLEGMQTFLGVSLIAVFAVCIWLALANANNPPRLADPVPSVVPSSTANNAVQPAQARGAYTPSANYLAIIAVVAPLLTTVIGFYFGSRSGAQAREAADARAANAQKQTDSVRGDATALALDAAKGAQVDDLRQKYPQLFGGTG